MPNPPPPPGEVPRVLLFGHRGSGKSALVGALLRAGEARGEILLAEPVAADALLPPPAQLPKPVHELQSFVVRFRPSPDATVTTVILDDCSGAAAEALLAHPDPITRRAPDSELARAVVEADAIMLLVDAASTRDQLREAFAAFDQFLTTVERAKTDARTVGGFPVFLVLTQCDRLVQPRDTAKTWEARVRDRVEYAWKAFDDFLKEADDGDDRREFLAFGSVDLTVKAVAIRRPLLDGLPAPAEDDPYQVPELFRACFAEAVAHQDRLGRSERRLTWTVRLALAAVGFMALALAGIALFPPSDRGPELAEQVADYRRLEPPAAHRLAREQIERNRRALQRFAGDGAFRALPEDLQTFVQSRLKEIADYSAYRAKLEGAAAPTAARTLPDLRTIRDRLRAEHPLPGEYSWGETDAALLRDKWLTDCAALEKAVEACVSGYGRRREAATELAFKKVFDSGWLLDIEKARAAGAEPPFAPSQVVPGSVAVPHRLGAAVTYRDALAFDESDAARRDEAEALDRLERVRDLTDALGLTTAEGRPPAVLALPRAAADPAALASERLSELAAHYPRLAPALAGSLPAVLRDRPELAGAARTALANGTRHAQSMMTVSDTVPGWSALSASLAGAKFRDWGALLQLLTRLDTLVAPPTGRDAPDPPGPDPVGELARFLANLDTKAFAIAPVGATLCIPQTLSGAAVKPTGPLTITLTHSDQTTEQLALKPGSGTVRGEATEYPLAAERPGELNYRPGEVLRAEMPLRIGDRDLKLLWEAGPPRTFQFDRLWQEPRLTKADGGTEPAPGVRLTFRGGVPKLPVLLPRPAK